MKSMSVLEKLQDFQYKDANGKDHVSRDERNKFVLSACKVSSSIFYKFQLQGANVRHRALEIMALVNDPVKLEEEREKASINKAKYIGVSGEALRTGGFGGGKSTSSFHGTGSTGSTLTTSSRSQYNSSTSPSNPSWQHKTRHEAYARRSPSISPRLRMEESRVDTESSNDAVAATRARIQKLKLEKQSSPRGENAELVGQKAAEKKKLTLGDVHVNPKIAASLGLKPVKKLYTKDTADNTKLTTQKNSSTSPDAGVEVDLLGLGTVDGTVDGTAISPEEKKSNGNEGTSESFADWNAFDQQASPPGTSAQTQGIAKSHLRMKERAGSDPFDDLTTARSVHSKDSAVGRGRGPALPEDMFSSLSAAPLSTKSAEKTESDQNLFADLLT